MSAELNSSRFARKFSAFGAVRIPRPSNLRRRRHAPRNTSPPRPRPPPQRERGVELVAVVQRLRRRAPSLTIVRSAHSVAPSHAPSPIVRSAHSVAPSHLQSLFEGWHGVGCQILRQAGHGAARSKGTQPPRSLVRFIYSLAYLPSPNKPPFCDNRRAKWPM